MARTLAPCRGYCSLSVGLTHLSQHTALSTKAGEGHLLAFNQVHGCKIKRGTVWYTMGPEGCLSYAHSSDQVPPCLFSWPTQMPLATPFECFVCPVGLATLQLSGSSALKQTHLVSHPSPPNGELGSGDLGIATAIP